MFAWRRWSGTTLVVAFSLVGVYGAEGPPPADVPSAKEDGATPARYMISLHLVEVAVDDDAIKPADSAVKMLSAAEAARWTRAVRDEPRNKTLSAPTIVTTEGCEARLQCGGEHFFAVGYDGDTAVMKTVPVGIRVTTTPRSLGDGRVRLELALRIARLIDVAKAALTAERGKAPRVVELPTVSEQAVNTTVVLPIGGAAIIRSDVRETDGVKRRSEALVAVERFDE